MFYKAKVADCSETHTAQINEISAPVEFLNVKPDGT
jgi:hypothetical protein